MKTLTAEIKQRATELGFSKVGIARAEHLSEEGERLNEWLARGFQATMEWVSRNAEKRVDPRKVLPDARSVIVVALNYYTDFRHSTEEGTGRVSRYAWGDDYHDILGEKLAELLEFIKLKLPQVHGKVYVDTGPVMEKAWAQRAGIGWIGKHTNLITQDYGSWVFLGELIINVEFEYDDPATDHCGSCTLCVEACPTEAIVEPYVLDSNRCISYLTIEHRGEIAEELGERFDRWVYGCDICQDVCPWNQRFSHPTIVEEFRPRAQTLAPSLAEWSEMSPKEFSENFSRSSMKRTKRSGLTRNAKLLLSSTTSGTRIDN